MRGGALAAEQPGGREHESAGADGADAFDLRCLAPDPVEQIAIFQQRLIADAARDQQRVRRAHVGVSARC